MRRPEKEIATMRIQGFQKLTLLDFPGKVACILFTEGCNFRCPFCHNAALVSHVDPSARLQEEEILRQLEKRKGILDGVCVTGGEPLLQNGIEDFLGKLKEMGFAVKLDTNGSFPERLKAIVKAGLVDYVAMDIKNAREKYAQTVGVHSFAVAPIEESAAFLLTGKVPFEFRTTVTRELHTPADIAAIADWIQGAPAYYIQNFVDSGDLVGQGMHPVSKEDLAAMKAEAEARGLPTRVR